MTPILRQPGQVGAQRADIRLIARIVPGSQRVLDLGCGTGELLEALIRCNGARGSGIEIAEENVIRCLEKGLSVYQGDIDGGLVDYPDQSYDYVIMNQTLQVIAKPLPVLREMLRVGRYGIVGFPNFGHWEVRLGLATTGRMPVSRTLPFTWYDTPNIHLFTIEDFKTLCVQEGVRIVEEHYAMAGQWSGRGALAPFANLLATQAVFVISNAP